ncbi:MAG: SHOCT domain-containing protein [Acidimicrobiales bacterium]|jgi:ABC-type multidrug transport system fused ATPase/permease subunit
MLAYTYPLANLFGTMLGFFIFLIWLWLLIAIFGDIFRSTDLSGASKALWVVFVVVLPYLGILVYLIARGGKMHERAAAQTQQQRQAFDSLIKESAQTGTADELEKLVKLRDQGVLTDAEFAAQKERLLA